MVGRLSLDRGIILSVDIAIAVFICISLLSVLVEEDKQLVSLTSNGEGSGQRLGI